MFCDMDWHGAVCVMYLIWECRLTLLQVLSPLTVLSEWILDDLPCHFTP
jgi:hypothetical protein